MNLEKRLIAACAVATAALVTALDAAAQARVQQGRISPALKRAWRSLKYAADGGQRSLGRRCGLSAADRDGPSAHGEGAGPRTHRCRARASRAMDLRLVGQPCLVDRRLQQPAEHQHVVRAAFRQ
jgi:hypothetical protein